MSDGLSERGWIFPEDTSVSYLRQLMRTSWLVGVFSALATATRQSYIVREGQSLRYWLRESRLGRTVVSIRETPIVSNSYAIRILKSVGHRLRCVLFDRSVTAKAKWLVAIAFGVRLLASPLSLLRINTYARADSVGFANSASAIASGLLDGQLVIGPIFRADGTVLIYHLWGTFLSPFWLLPGPSDIYAHLGLAGVGALAVYNVYVIASRYHSPAAGVVAALPVAVYPSFVFVQATLLREAAVLAGITTAVRLLVAPPTVLKSRARLRGTLIGVTLLFVALLRYDNIPLYALALGVGFGAYYLQNSRFRMIKNLVVGTSVGTALLSLISIAPEVTDFLARTRHLRSTGRTAYLVRSMFQTAPEMVLFAPLGAAHVLFTPFPWMIGNILDFVIAIEALGNILFAIASISGVRYVLRQSIPATSALVIGFLAASLLYGLGTVNVGTAVRHRQMFIWIIYIFGAIGLIRWVKHRGTVS